MTTDEPRDLGESLARLYQKGLRQVEDLDARREAQRLTAEWEKRIPLRFQDARLEHVDEPAREQLAEWASGAPGPKTNIVLLGPVGVGKTYAAVAAMRVLHDHGKTVLFAPVVEALDWLRPGGPPDTPARLSQAGCLLLDDVGAERPTDWTTERLYGIVNRRWLNQLPTIVTTNVPAEELEPRLDPRLFSRLVHNVTAIRLGGADRRR